MVRQVFFIALFLASPLLAAPPTIDIPAEIKATSEYVTITPKTDAVAITYVAQSGVEPFPSAFLKDPRSFVLPTRGLAIGRYKFVAVGSKDDEHTRVDFVVVIGDAPVPPTPPVPPGPNPPTPPTPPVVSGKRALLLIHETADDTPDVSRMIVGLRTGTAAEYLKSKGHTLSILDDDLMTPALEAWRPHFSGMKLPALFVIDAETKALIHKQEVPAGTTSAQVIDIVKAKGG